MLDRQPSHIHEDDLAATNAVFRFGEARVDVGVDDNEVMRWLAEFLTPWFQTSSSGRADLRVQMTSARDRFTTLSQSKKERIPRPFPCFSLDSAVVSYPGWVDENGVTVVACEEFGCYYRILPTQVEVVSRPQDRSARIGLMRAVRELATLRAISYGETLDLHAAAFVFQGRAVLLLGDKRAGKTTLLAHALASREAALLANDRVIVDGKGLLAHGVPTVVFVRPGTREIFADFMRDLPQYANRLHAGELASIDAAQMGTEERLLLSPAQFARRMGAPIESQAPIGAVVFPEISTTTPTYSLVPMTPDQAVARLNKSRYGFRSGPREYTLFQSVAGVPTNADTQSPLIYRLATAVPQVRCLLSKAVYHNSASDWLRALPMADVGPTP